MSDARCSRGWGARCSRAQSPRCRCNCGGQNHGNPAARRDRDSTPKLTNWKLFEGEPLRTFVTSEARDVRLWRDGNDACADIRQRLVYHSPSGFEWGYGGSGPADLALNILALYVPAPDAWHLHQDFKWQFVSKMPREGGVIRGADIREWIERQWSQELALGDSR